MISNSISVVHLFFPMILLGAAVHCGLAKLESAIRAGKTNMLARYLKSEMIRSDTLNSALVQALQNDKLEIVELILKSDRVNPSVGDNKAIRWASNFGYLNIVEELLKDPRVNPAAHDNAAVRSASHNGHLNVVQALLKDPRVNPAAHDNGAIRSASYNGHLAVIETLLKDPRVDPTAEDNEAIRQASYYGHINVVKALLKDPRVDPSSHDNEAIRVASYRGHSSIVELLLKDPRVDPRSRDNGPIRVASQNGHTSVIAALLKDDRVDPAVRSNFVFQNAVEQGNLELVKLLLKHKKVNPADNDNAVMRFFLENRPVINVLNERRDILKLLLEDGRADPTIYNNEIFNQVKKYRMSPTKLLLENDPRVKSIEYLNTGTTPLTGNSFLNLIKSDVQLSTPSYIENVFSGRKNHLVASFLADFLQISLEEANKIHNLDDLNMYVIELHKSIYQLPQEYKEFLWRYYSIRPDLRNMFQELTVYLVKNGFVFRKDVIPNKISNP